MLFRSIEVVIRPEDLKLVSPEAGLLKGIVKSVVFKGVHYEMLVKEADRTWMIHSTTMEQEGTPVGLMLTPDDIHIMSKEG